LRTGSNFVSKGIGPEERTFRLNFPQSTLVKGTGVACSIATGTYIITCKGSESASRCAESRFGVTRVLETKTRCNESKIRGKCQDSGLQNNLDCKCIRMHNGSCVKFPVKTTATSERQAESVRFLEGMPPVLTVYGGHPNVQVTSLGFDRIRGASDRTSVS
jgi:hypothetical protein